MKLEKIKIKETRHNTYRNTFFSQKSIHHSNTPITSRRLLLADALADDGLTLVPGMVYPPTVTCYDMGPLYGELIRFSTPLSYLCNFYVTI